MKQDGLDGAVWIPTVIVLIALIGSIALPIAVLERVNRLRMDVTVHAEPLREECSDLFVAYATEVSSLRAYLIDGDALHLLRYREARRTETEVLARLSRAMPKIDARSEPVIRRIQERINGEHAVHEALFASRMPRESYARELPAAEQVFSDISGDITVLQEMVRHYQAERRIETDETVTTGGFAIAALVLLGLVAAMFVSRLSLRLQVFSRELARRTSEEVTLRNVASAVNAAVSINEVLSHASTAACEITGADGAYVERISTDKQTVEVVVTAGNVTPRPGTTVPYPGSLTEDILARGEPVIAPEIGQAGAAMAAHLSERCGPCELILVPLISEGVELGAFVVVNSRRGLKRFGPADVGRAVVLGNLAAVAMRRVRILERERAARQTAEDAVRARDEILSIVSHDLRAPLTTISLSAQMLDDAAGAAELRIIRESVQRMQRLVEDLLDVAQIERGRLTIRKREIEPAEIVAKVCRSFGAAAADKAQHLECAAERGLPIVDADPDRLMQVFANLVTNAMKFTPEGGDIVVRAARLDDMVHFSVSDTGPGIPSGALTSVFQRFWQAKKTAHLGAGLGLTIAKGIVEAHGGTIEAANLPGSGAEFRFTIPLAAAADRAKDDLD